MGKMMQAGPDKVEVIVLDRGCGPQRCKAGFDVGEAHVLALPALEDGRVGQWRRQERPSRCTRSSALGGPHVPAA